MLPVEVHRPSGTLVTQALLHLGSQVTLVTDAICDRLGISGPADELTLCFISGSKQFGSRYVSFSVQPLNNTDEKFEVCDARTTPRLSVTGQPVD